MTHPSREIACTACGQHALARIEPLYEGFKRVGEEVVCTACGHRYPGVAAAPFAAAAGRPRVFAETDRPHTPKIFADDERRKSCGWCAHFVVNPFSQRCGLANREVEATDLCVRFKPKPGAAAATDEARPEQEDDTSAAPD